MRAILETLRASKTATTLGALGISATLLAGCGRSGPSGWPDNPCIIETAGIPVAAKDGSNPHWYCTTGGRTDGLTNEQAAGGSAAHAPDSPPSVATPRETSRSLTPEEQLAQNAAYEAEIKHSYEYIASGEKMSYDQLVDHFSIPSNVTDPALVVSLLEQHLNELANGCSTTGEYLRNNTAFDKAVAEDRYDKAIPAVEYRKFYCDAGARALMHPDIDSDADYIGRNVDPAYQKPLYREFIFTRNNAEPFTVKHDMTLVEGAYLPADESVARPFPEMGLRVKYKLTYSGATGTTRVKDGTESTDRMIYLRVLDGRWVVLYNDRVRH